MEKELTAAVTTQEPMLADSLIVVQQLPVIKEQLHSIKAQAQASVTEADRKSTRLNSSHYQQSRMPSSA